MHSPRRGAGPTIALIGDPVAHSISPAMQRAAFSAAGLDLDYVAQRVRRNEVVATFHRLRTSLVGLNVTRPLKEAVLPLLDAVSPAARTAGSVNTVTFLRGRASGDSTDGAGLLAALAQVKPEPARRAMILGTGGAARAIAAALGVQGTAVVVSGRNAPAGERLVRNVAMGVGFLPMDSPRFPGELAQADLLVNATPLGGPEHRGIVPLPPSLLHPKLTVVDMVYLPRRTALLSAALAVGCSVVEGVEVLIEQGARSFGLWTGRPCPVRAMREAALEALKEADGGRVDAASLFARERT